MDWAVELQSLAQAGLYYSKDPYDRERFQRIREISAEILSRQSEMPYEKVTDLFCGETGYQTPKLDCRAAVFRENRILLVKENNGTWSLPGGWVDAGLSVKENVIKEVREEAGLDVTADRVIAIQDRDKHNMPVSAYKICKIFFLCTVTAARSEKILKRWKAVILRQPNCPCSRRRKRPHNKSKCVSTLIALLIGKFFLIEKSGGIKKLRRRNRAGANFGELNCR